MSPRPLQTSSSAMGGGCLMLFFAIFLLAGLAVLVGINVDDETSGGDRIGGSIVAMIFVLVGGGGVYAGFRMIGASRRELSDSTPQSERERAWMKLIPKVKTRRGVHGGVAIPPETSRFTAMIGLGIFSLIWNGVVVMIFFVGMKEKSWVPWIFGGIFGLFGILILIGFITETLKYFGTGETVMELGEEPLHPGATTTLRLTQAGTFTITSAKVILECREKVTYQAGTNTVTVHETVYEKELAEVRDTAARDGVPLIDLEFAIPDDAAVSWFAPNNSIEWHVRLVVDIPGKPDLDERYVFRVLPPEVDRSMLPERQKKMNDPMGEWS